MQVFNPGEAPSLPPEEALPEESRLIRQSNVITGTICGRGNPLRVSQESVDQVGAVTVYWGAIDVKPFAPGDSGG